MATRTAPAATGAPNEVLTSLSLVDASGDLYASTLKGTTIPTDIQTEALAAAYQAGSKASLYRIIQTRMWVGDIDPQNADVGQRNSVKDGVNMLWRNDTTLMTQSPRLVAPVDAVMQGNQDIPLWSAQIALDLNAAILAILSGFTLRSVQYTERRERSNNPRVRQ